MRILLGLFFAMTLSAAGREVAITIDDLPRGGGDRGPRDLASVRAMTVQLLAPFREQKIPVIGFVNEGNASFGPKGLREILDLWLDAGAELGNHGYGHLNINQVPLAQYTRDIVKGEPVLREALGARGKTLTFYRHPFLFTGPTPEIKEGMQRFLDQHHYRVAPVTLDNNDWEFAKIYLNPEYKERVRREYVPYMESVVEFFERRSVEVVGREIPQVLLIHASQMNADLMPELLAMFRRRGYAFVSLEHALADEAYRLPDTQVFRNGISWIHRWGMSKSMPLKMEPDSPAWVREAKVAFETFGTDRTDEPEPASSIMAGRGLPHEGRGGFGCSSAVSSSLCASAGGAEHLSVHATRIIQHGPGGPDWDSADLQHRQRPDAVHQCLPEWELSERQHHDNTAANRLSYGIAQRRTSTRAGCFHGHHHWIDGLLVGSNFE